jgi:hypothetical protein
MASPKPWYKSKTIVTNGAVIIAALVGLIQSDQFNTILDLLPPEVKDRAVMIAGIVMGLYNLYLRYKTNSPIALKAPSDDE